ncbi:glyoxylase-like metal-dependent hydrolase (beta-lactamase superfamily II) [Variovorax paradoxus]|uniref:Glyoxylase-like metal-dependent hydrolase (Beta-lactamase superfamily II) n=1 Tax=Variovorax paradoxus TaxID=34073 RepID=A0AAE4BZA2_VARPD|nr:MBL fold metallo-hydrolase [Variovorax paradoxus]MDP9965387.1 glyoxylase-like metal-dependent hydrolase (beta-lactamase superfamily II) [Variovorax paradoxus]MDR6429946.1 glyoxylase-like metal-dependent hydrolase (beta-lactamase superfamily II) [Variovorax paradoxus]
MKTVLNQRRIFPALLASLLVLGCGGSDSRGNGGISIPGQLPGQIPGAGPENPPEPPAAPVFRASGLVYGTPAATSDDKGNDTISIPVLTQSGARSLSVAVPTAKTAALLASLAPGSLVDWIPGSDAGTVAVPDGATPVFNVILAKGKSTAAQFNLKKYGAAVSRNDNAPGPMVAAGWVYDKTGATITVGDGQNLTADQAGRPYAQPIRRYEETYAVSPDVKVFNVNTADYAKSAVSDFASIPVTASYDYGTTSRQSAYLLFDNNYLAADTAKVVAIWYFTPPSTTDGKPVWDVPTLSTMLDDKGSDPVSGQPYSKINATSPSSAPYSRSTEPFEMVKNTMYYVGDNEVASYLLKADMGTPNDPSDDKVIKVDAGWPNSGYQYWKNMELVGVDPRSVTDIWLTHGHSDHYGTVVEQLRMMDNAGKPIALWASKEDAVGVTSDLQGNAWNITGALPASETVIRERISHSYEYDKWYDYGNVKIMVIWSPGHTPGSTNMLFKVKNPGDGKFYTFGYHGGYGFNGLNSPTAANGWLRLSFQHGFSYLQNTLDVDFVAPQHTNQFPIVEVYQALKAYNRDPANAGAPLTMLDAMRSKVFDSPAVGGVNITGEFSNQLEKRRSVASYAASDAANATYKSIETSGPFKPGREAGLTSVSARILDDGKIIQGFVGPQNKNPKLPLLANGITTSTDQYVNDPGGYYVQVAIDVQDTVYKGYIPEGFTQFSPGLGTTITYKGGPVESVHADKGSFHPPEYLRTQRLGSLADAQAVLATIAKGQTKTISLTRASEIVVPAVVTQTFQ